MRGLFNKYGLTLDAYNAILLTQNNACAICKIDASSDIRALRVDHDHITKKVRGLLCHRCNTGIGLLRENPETLKAAIEYLAQ